MNRLILGVFFLNAPAYVPTSEEVRIRLHADTDLEKRGRDQLERLLRTYDLNKWLFTHDVLIQSRVLPHSHPVLTLNTRYLDHDISWHRSSTSNCIGF